MAATRKKTDPRSTRSLAPAGRLMLRAAAVVVGAGLLFGGGVGVGAWIAGEGSADRRVAGQAKQASPESTAPALRSKVSEDPRVNQSAQAEATNDAKAPPGIPLPKMTGATGAGTPAARGTLPSSAVAADRLASAGATAGAAEPALPTWRRFAVAADTTSGKPKIAIVLDDLGIDLKRSRRAVALPAALTLAYLPYAEGLADQTRAARQAGHELLLHVPMQPHGADVDPGPNALDMRLGAIEVLSRLEWGLDRFEGYVGINNHMGSLFTESAEGMRLVAEGLRDRELMFLDSLTSPKSVAAATVASYGVPTTVRDVFLDNTDTAAEVEMRLEQTERIARKTGTAIAIGHPRDATLNVLEAWIPKALEAGFALVPLTAVLQVRQGVATQQASRP